MKTGNWKRQYNAEHMAGQKALRLNLKYLKLYLQRMLVHNVVVMTLRELITFWKKQNKNKFSC